MEAVTPFLLLGGGLLIGILVRILGRSRDDDGSSDLDGIDSIAGRERDRIAQERGELELERGRLDRERGSLDSEREQLEFERDGIERERGINARTNELLAELTKRAIEKKK